MYRQWCIKYVQSVLPDTASAYEAYAPSGGNTTTTYSASPGGTIFIGQYTPFGNGVFYAKVTNNDDTAISAGGAPGSATHDTDNIVVVTIVATMRSGIQRRISASVEYVSPKSTGPKLAAIVSSTSISFNGNITVDGNDHDINGVVNHRADSFAAISGGSIGFGGASQAGGNGIAPARGGAAGVTNAANGDWTAMNSAPSGGGPTPTTFPSDPDGVMKTAPGSLKAAAIASGTYFTTQGAYNAAVSAAGGKVPGGKIIYCEFTPGPPFELGSAYNDVPSILIVHNATSDADMKNVHGNFKGLLIADSVTHINAGTQILGSVVAWGQSGNVFGNGNSDVMYSTEVLDNLPGLAPANSLLMRDYRKEVPAGSVP